MHSNNSSQTENFPNYGELLCNLQEMSVQEIKDHYEKMLNFLNDCHEYMNEIFAGEKFEFRVPEVPNYFTLMEMFLERHKHKVQENPTKREFFAAGNGKTIAIKQPAQFPISLKTLSSAFEEIYKTCNNLESKSEVVLNTKHKFGFRKEAKFNPEQGDQALQRKSTIEIELDESFIKPRLSISMENFTESDQSLSDFINSETLSDFIDSEPQSSSLSENLNLQQIDDCEAEVIQANSIIASDYGKKFTESEAGSSSRSSTIVEKHQRKSYPFTLSNRDRCRDDIKEIITAMGLYTENGDIRPNIIQFLDKELSFRTSEKSVKFNERQPDIQVHYNNRNMRVASEEELLIPSEGNLGVSTGNSSSTIVSESEIINIPNCNNKQKKIN